MTLEQLEALEKAATPGPWTAATGEDMSTYQGSQYHRVVGPDPCGGAHHMCELPRFGRRPAEDAALIAAARTYLPKLLAVARAANDCFGDLLPECAEAEDARTRLEEALAALEG